MSDPVGTMSFDLDPAAPTVTETDSDGETDTSELRKIEHAPTDVVPE